MAGSTQLYQLTLSERQVAVIAHALDFWNRCRGGQLEELRECVHEDVDFETARNAIDDLKQVLRPDLGAGGGDFSYPGGNLAFNLRKLLEHGLSWTKRPDGGWTVNFDGPMGGWWEGEPPAVMLRFEGDEAVRIRDRANKETTLISKLADVLGTTDVEEGVALVRQWKQAALGLQETP